MSEKSLKVAPVCFTGEVISSLIALQFGQLCPIGYLSYDLPEVTQAINAFMKTEKTYYVGIHPNIYKSGEPGEVIGVVLVELESGEFRPCFHVRFENADEDYKAIIEEKHYELISETDFINGKIPEVVY